MTARQSSLVAPDQVAVKAVPRRTSTVRYTVIAIGATSHLPVACQIAKLMLFNGFRRSPRRLQAILTSVT